MTPEPETNGLVDSGLAYCTVHHGVIECDGGDGPCDFQGNGDPDFVCPGCGGEGRIEDNRGEWQPCFDCDRGGLTLCRPTPLLYEQPAGQNGGSSA